MADYTLKQNDTWPPLRIQLKEGTPTAPMDLTDAVSVTLHLVKQDKSVRIATDPCDIPEPTDGWIEWTPNEGDTAFVGVYDAEADIDWGDGKRQTVPNSSYLTVEILASLDPEEA
jgi:hypothetical protein